MHLQPCPIVHSLWIHPLMKLGPSCSSPYSSVIVHELAPSFQDMGLSEDTVVTFSFLSTKITNTLNWHNPHVLAFPNRYSKSYLTQVTTFFTFFLTCTKDRCLVCIAYKFWPVCTSETISVSREWTCFHCPWFTRVKPSACLDSGHVFIAPNFLCHVIFPLPCPQLTLGFILIILS